ncbi:MAG TPA: CmcJ/NvfI family oxidoreductase [Steroidobacteraceae bacterium]|nr:CmcJ/NvfI family oxidoreductase [Steroidobacteraceae bacterium]
MESSKRGHAAAGESDRASRAGIEDRARSVEDNARSVEAQIVYVAHGSFINRRFVAPGVEHNTGQYEAHTVKVRDARPIAGHFKLDTHGFELVRHVSAVRDFFDRAEVDAIYPGEVAAAVKAVTGATRVATLGWMARTSGDLTRFKHRTVGYTHSGGVQPPAGEAHVDTAPDRADRMARSTYERAFTGGPGYSRFLYSSFWRAFSEPPQDTPLAVCDGRSVRAEEGTTNTMFVVDNIPDESTMLGPMQNEDQVPGAAIFHFSPAHRWWYFSRMTRDEAIVVKFHDSDRARVWRTPHTAFRDPTFPDAKPRHSIEFRTIAYFE